MAEKKTILIVEDDPFIAKAYTAKLEQEGYAVEVATDGKEGFDALEKVRPNLILLDMMMPEMDGFEFIKKQMAGEYKDIPTIVLTNLGQKHDEDEVRALGAKDYLIKANMNFSDILDTIEKYIK